MTKKKFYKMLLARGYQRDLAAYMTMLAARQRFLQAAGYAIYLLDDEMSYEDFLNDRNWLAHAKYYFTHAKHKDQWRKQLREAANNPRYTFSY